MTIEDIIKLVDISFSLTISLFIIWLHLTVIKDINVTQTKISDILAVISDNIKDIQDGRDKR